MIKNLLILLFFIFSYKSFSQGVIFRDYDLEKNPAVERSHWRVNLTGEMIRYKVLHNYTGKKNSFSPSEQKTYMGGGLGLSRQFRVSERFRTSSHLNLFQFKKEDRRINQASEELEYNVSDTIEEHKLYGAQFAQSFEYRVRAGSWYVEPFIQFGIGYGNYSSRIDYYWDDLAGNQVPSAGQPESIKEAYKVKISEDIFYQNIALGLSFISRAGLVSYFKVQKNTMAVGTRTIKGRIDTDTADGTAGPTRTNINQKEKIDSTDDEYSIGLGMGYIF